MTTTLRWGLLGTAHINRRLIPAMRVARRSKLVAVASRDASRSKTYAREWNITTAHGTYDALLRDRRVDAIYIPLPNSLHVEWTLRALDAGKHVLCEKPLALVPEDVDRIAAVARARSLAVAEAFMYRHEPLTMRVTELLRAGAVGQIGIIETGFSYLRRRAMDVRLDPALGGGSLWDVGCYAVNLARVVAGGEPLAVSGFATTHSSGVDDAFTGMLQFPNDIIATVHSSFRATYRGWLQVTGADGTLCVTNVFRPRPAETIELWSGDDHRRIAVEGSAQLFVRQIEDFVAAALEGKMPAVSLSDSRGNAAALAALHDSARTRRAVAI